MAFSQASISFFGLAALLAAPLSSAAVLKPRQEGDEGACMRQSTSVKWDVTDFVPWGGEPSSSSSKGMSFHIRNTATGYETDCKLSIEPPALECGKIDVKFDEASSNITVTQQWTCPQPNWPTE